LLEVRGTLLDNLLSHTIYLALGTNLGDRPANLRAALDALEPDIHVLDKSPVYETEPWGYTDQPPFLNMVICAETDLSPKGLLRRLKDIEATLGRVPNFRNGPRLIDLDILFYDDLVLDTPPLVIPHPQLHKRAFVLVPLAKIAPTLVHPLLGLSVEQFLGKIDQHGIKLYSG
jgi:2-amino-4-hydroxy-6-hydroxymethyldihydropteridine diphosphokinase